MTDNITVREVTSTNTSLKIKKRPSEGTIAVPFDYCPSDDGTDENLLILLHGLGGSNIHRVRHIRANSQFCRRHP